MWMRPRTQTIPHGKEQADCLAVAVNCCCRCSQPATCLAICYIELFFVMPFHLDDFIVCAGGGWEERAVAIDGARIVNPSVLTERLVSPLFLGIWKGAIRNRLEKWNCLLVGLCLMGLKKHLPSVLLNKNRFELSRFFPINLDRDRNLEGTPPTIYLWRNMVCLGTVYFIDLENIWLTLFFGSFSCGPSICFCVNQATTKNGAHLLRHLAPAKNFGHNLFCSSCQQTALVTIN